MDVVVVGFQDSHRLGGGGGGKGRMLHKERRAMGRGVGGAHLTDLNSSSTNRVQDTEILI